MNKLVSSAFIFGGLAASALISSPATHATSATCVDGTVKSNIIATIAPDDTVSITTKGNAPLCKDQILYWDSYTMPDNYDGKPFGTSANAAPQTQYSHAVITMKAGSKSASAKIALPTCKNVQTDLYYGPELKTITSAGHGKQFIVGEINGFPTSYTGSRAKDLAKCATPVTPTTPTTPTSPTTPTPVTPTPTPTPVTPTPVTPTPETPATPATPETPVTETPAVETPAVETPAVETPVTELPSTGISENLTIVFAAILAAGTYGVSRFVSRKNA